MGDYSTERQTRLTGGVSCEVAIVRDAEGREIVIKEALPRLRVAADWRSDPARASVEVAALRTLRRLLGPGTVPSVLWEDAQHHRFAMERIDPSFRNWRDELNHRRVALDTAQRVGELLAAMHGQSAADPHIAEQFANREYFVQLRIEPFFRRIAQRNPDLAAQVDEAIQVLLAPGSALVHGDFSPKNMLVRGHEVVILDCEVAHWGNPRFDLAFCLMHLMLDGLHKPPAGPFVQAALTMLDAYESVASASVFDAALVRITGCLVLARLEGDSPIDFLGELDAPRVKELAVELIRNPVADPRAAVRRIEDREP